MKKMQLGSSLRSDEVRIQSIRVLYQDNSYSNEVGKEKSASRAASMDYYSGRLIFFIKILMRHQFLFYSDQEAGFQGSSI